MLETFVFIGMLLIYPVGAWMMWSAWAAGLARVEAPKAAPAFDRAPLFVELRASASRCLGDDPPAADVAWVGAAHRILTGQKLTLATLDQLSDAATEELWVFFRLINGTEDQVAALLADQSVTVRAQISMIRAEVADDRARRRAAAAEAAWIRDDPAGWDRATRVPAAQENLVKWLGEQDPHTWHAIVVGWDWNREIAPLTWIANRPECDRATAARMFLSGGAVEAVAWGPTRQDAPAARRDHWDLLSHLARGLARGKYKRADLTDDAPSRERYVIAQGEVGERRPWPEIPAEALGPFVGKPPASAFYLRDGVVRRRVERSG